MFVFVFSKNLKNIFIYTIIIVIFLLKNSNFAGTIIQNESGFMYKNDYGELAKDTWVWIDTNNDSIAECYRFDRDGFIAKNYIHYDGKKTNDKGQLLEDNIVVRKITSIGKILTSEDLEYKPKLKDTDNYINGNILLPKNMNKRLKQKIEDIWFLGSETLDNDDAIDGEIIDDAIYTYKPLSEIVPESGVIYSKSTKEEDIAIGKDGKIILGKNAVNFITTSNKFEKEVKEAVVFNGDIWKNCMEMKGNKSQVKFLLNQYNYMYFEISNENHINETYRRKFEAVLSIYADDELLEEIYNFTDSNPQIVELDLDGKKTVTLKLDIRNGNLSERVFINNARFRKYD